MYDIFAPRNNARVRITRDETGAVRIKTPYCPANRNMLQRYVPAVDWDRFLEAWTGILPEYDDLNVLVSALKLQFLSPVLVTTHKETYVA